MSLGVLIGSTISSHISVVTGDLTVSLRIALIMIGLLAVYLSILPESLRSTPAPLPFVSNISGNSVERGIANSIASSTSTIRSAFSLAKESMSMIFDQVLLVLPGRVPRSTNLPITAAPAILLFIHFIVIIANYGTSFTLQNGPLTEYTIAKQPVAATMPC